MTQFKRGYGEYCEKLRIFYGHWGTELGGQSDSIGSF
jgi:hypothetical protein